MDLKIKRVPRRNKRAYLKYKELVRRLVLSRLELFNTVYEYEYNRVCVRNQKTCWGSCTAKKNLNFSYRIIFLPERIRDYIIVHELCHLGELNHSRNFWSLVGRVLPDYSEYKRVLRKII